jgi:hypothetical protein
VVSIPTAPTKSPVESVALTTRGTRFWAKKAQVLAPSCPHYKIDYTLGYVKIRVAEKPIRWGGYLTASGMELSTSTVVLVPSGSVIVALSA